MQFNDILAALDVDLSRWQGRALTARSPVDGATLATLAADAPADAERKIDAAHQAFLKWRTVPAPVRGELVRVFGNVLREHKAALGRLVTLEAGKIASEGLGEVQEMIDICDFAVGLSRQLYGLT
ncbi:aldehyde dehydrogenase family protein, partial [Burkholderia pseudomallei]